MGIQISLEKITLYYMNFNVGIYSDVNRIRILK